MAIALHMTFQPYGGGVPFTIEVNMVSFDFEQVLNIGSTSTGSGAGKVTFNPLSFTKKPDMHSATFFSMLCSGTAFQRVEMDTASSAAGTSFFTVTMGLVALKTMSFTVSEGDGYPLEAITVEFGQVACSVTPQNPDGSFAKLGLGSRAECFDRSVQSWGCLALAGCVDVS